MREEWLWGWDPTPGIVSVWADDRGRATIWRREPASGRLLREEDRFRPWALYDQDVGFDSAAIDVRRLDGPGELRYLLSAADGRTLSSAILEQASQRAGRRLEHVRDVDFRQLLLLPPDEQYLVATGRTYFRDLSYSDLRRLQFDLETTGLDPHRDRIFLIAIRDPDGRSFTLEANTHDDAGEADLIARFSAHVQTVDPDVIENHNLQGFDLPFLDRRSRTLRVPLTLGRTGGPGLKQRGARFGARSEWDDDRRVRFVAPGREFFDTLDAVRRHDFSARDLPGHGLKAVARHFGIAGPDRVLIPGAEIFTTYHTDPERVRRYAIADVEEVAALSQLLGGAAFALARMAPRRYERLADAGAATGVIDPLLVRAYLRANTALPAHEPSDGTMHSGAALHLFATGAAHRVVKADVASLYPSLMRAYRIGPSRDRLGALLALVDALVVQRLAAKSAAKAAGPGSAERYTQEAISAAMKLVVNSAYGYLAAGGDLTRFADVHAANEVTRRGRETLNMMCRELASRGVTLLEADTDGVYFAVPDAWTEADERRVVSEVAALLPDLVNLEFEGRYAAMLSHEPKNYALLGYDGTLLLRGVAFRSSRAEPFGEHFLRRALRQLLVGDIQGVRDAYVETLDQLRHHQISTHDVSSRVRLTKTPEEYLATRESRAEFPYEAMLASGRTTWRSGDRVRVYRTRNGSGSVVPNPDEEQATARDLDPRDYDVEHYARILRDNFAARMERALTPEDFATVFAEPDQLTLFAHSLDSIRPILTSRRPDSASEPRPPDPSQAT